MQKLGTDCRLQAQVPYVVLGNELQLALPFSAHVYVSETVRDHVQLGSLTLGSTSKKQRGVHHTALLCAAALKREGGNSLYAMSPAE